MRLLTVATAITAYDSKALRVILDYLHHMTQLFCFYSCPGCDVIQPCDAWSSSCAKATQSSIYYLLSQVNTFFSYDVSKEL